MDQYQLLIDALKRKGVLRNSSIISAFKCIDRKDFVPDEGKEMAYEDTALPIGWAQTISQPFTVAFMLELLSPQAGEKIIDVGSGSGWTTALLAEIVGPTGSVFGVERIPELVDFGRKNLAKYDFKQAEIVRAGEELGLSKHAPFDRILVSAAAASLSQPLIDQLKVGGVMVIPVGDALQKITRLPEEEIKIERHGGFLFVPLL